VGVAIEGGEVRAVGDRGRGGGSRWAEGAIALIV